jgi:hypothetical protein
MARDSLPELCGSGHVLYLASRHRVGSSDATRVEMAFAGRSPPTKALSVNVGELECAVSRGRDLADAACC